MKTSRIINVRNKLGKQFGKRDIQATTWVGDQNLNSMVLRDSEEGIVFPGDQQVSEIEKLILEVLGLQRSVSIPISVDSQDDYNLDVSRLGPGKFQLLFKTTRNGGLRDGDSSVNVTIGPDEQPKLLAVITVISLIIGLVAGPILYKVSPILLGAAVGASAAFAIFSWFKTRTGKKK